MSNVVSVKRFKQFPQLMWILLFGSFITRGSYYMVWPFLAVILYENFPSRRRMLDLFSQVPQ